MADLPTPRTCRVLALDGGGIKGAFGAAFLSTIEEKVGRPIGDHFDLVVGTSTGAIIALAIGLGIPMLNVEQLYAKGGTRIFPTLLPGLLGRAGLWTRHWVLPRRSPRRLYAELSGVFGDLSLADSQCRLVIPAVNVANGDVRLFKTRHHERLRFDHSLRAVDVAMATSAAPTYFPAHVMADGNAYVDGGLWANCPALVGVVEAIAVLGHDRLDVDVLSIGATDSPLDVPRVRRGGGKLRWAPHVADTLMHASAAGALAQAELLTRRQVPWDGVMRVSEPVAPGRFVLDDAGRVDDLRQLGRTRAMREFEVVAARFLHAAAEPFQPVPH